MFTGIRSARPTPTLVAAAALAAAALLAAPAPDARAQCEPTWSPTFAGTAQPFVEHRLFERNHPDAFTTIDAMLTVQGEHPGDRPALYVAGKFRYLGGFAVGGVARWDGATWSGLAGGVAHATDPLNARVRDLALFDDDGPGPRPAALYAAGRFTSIGGQEISGIARWNGESWEPLGAGLIPVIGPGSSLGVSINRLAVIDPDGPGPLPPALYAAGSFSLPGGTTPVNIATWDGQTWTAVAGGTPDGILDLAAFDPDGPGPQPPQIIIAGGSNAWRIAALVDGQWTPLGTPPNHQVTAIAVFDEDGDGPLPPYLVASGLFASIGGVTVTGSARWNGSSWSSLGVPGHLRNASRLIPLDEDGDGPIPPALYAVGGLFQPSDLGTLCGIVRYTGSEIQRLAVGSINGGTCVVHYDADGPGPEPSRLLLGGGGPAWGDDPPQAARIAQWDGAAWRRFGNSPGARAYFAAEFDEDGPGPAPPALFVAGEFRSVGAIDALHIARWDGREWSTVGGNPPLPPGGTGSRPTPSAMAVLDIDGDDGPELPALYLAVFQQTTETTSTHRLLRWDGATWSEIPVGTPQFGDFIHAIATFDPDGPGPQPPSLVVGGRFEAIGGVAARNIARWDGAAWHSLGGGADNAVLALHIHDSYSIPPTPPSLYAGGAFTFVNGSVYAPCIARWDGASWYPAGSTINESFAPGVPPVVHALTTFDADGPGGAPPALFAGGDFRVPGHDAYGVARYDGELWAPVGSGVGVHQLPVAFAPAVRSLAVFDPDGAGPLPPALYAGGAFTTAGGLPAQRVASWNGHAWSPLGSGLRRVEFDWFPEPDPIVATTLAVADLDGEGPNPPALFATGNFSTSGDVSAMSIARWGAPQVVIARHPAPAHVPAGGVASLTIVATGPGPLQYQWRRHGVPLADGGPIAGSATPVLTIAPAAAAYSGQYDVVVSGPCGTTISRPATLTISCPADWNNDGAVNSNDISAFLATWLASIQDGTLDADFNGDTFVNSNDISAFLAAWLSAINQGC